MSDRCEVQLYCAPADAHHFEAVGFYPCGYPEDKPDVVAHLVDPEANYGAQAELMAIANLGVAFCGSHDHGAEYDGSMFAAHGGEYREIFYSHGVYLAPVDRDGNVSDNTRAAIRAFWAADDAVRKALGLGQRHRRNDA